MCFSIVSHQFVTLKLIECRLTLTGCLNAFISEHLFLLGASNENNFAQSIASLKLFS